MAVLKDGAGPTRVDGSFVAEPIMVPITKRAIVHMVSPPLEANFQFMKLMPPKWPLSIAGDGNGALS